MNSISDPSRAVQQKAQNELRRRNALCDTYAKQAEAMLRPIITELIQELQTDFQLNYSAFTSIRAEFIAGHVIYSDPVFYFDLTDPHLPQMAAQIEIVKTVKFGHSMSSNTNHPQWTFTLEKPLREPQFVSGVGFERVVSTNYVNHPFINWLGGDNLPQRTFGRKIRAALLAARLRGDLNFLSKPTGPT